MLAQESSGWGMVGNMALDGWGMIGSSDEWTHVAVASTVVGANWSGELVVLQPNTHHNKGLVMGV